MPKKGEISWPPELFDRAAAMWRAGKSGDEIGCAIHKSRNAVIGMMTRKGVKTPILPKSRRYVTIRKPGPHTPEPRRIAVPAQKPRPPRDFRIGKRLQPKQEAAPAPAVFELQSAPAPLDVTFADLEDGMCKWSSSPGHFCGVAVRRGHTYCPYHDHARTAKWMAAIKAAARDLSANAQGAADDR